MFEAINESNSRPTDEDTLDKTHLLQSVIVPQNEDQTENSEDKQNLSKKVLKEKSKTVKNELEDIHKETQRIVRESCISIPYHKPKQRSLTEFLQRHQAIPAVPLRTSIEKLNQVWKHLEEREKNAEKFYKSDSESEDEITEKENSFSSVTNNQACSDVTECTDVIDRNEKNKHTPLVSEIDCSGDINDKNEGCVESTSQSNGVALIECDFTRNTDEHLDCNGVDNETFNKEKPDGYSNDNSTVDKNVPVEYTTNEFILRSEMKPYKESSCESSSNNNKLSEDDTFSGKEQVKIPKFLQIENGIINLSSSEEYGVSDLMERFIKHTNLKPRTEKKSHLNISVTSTECDENGHITNIKEDILNILQPENNSNKEENPKLQRPGAKLAKLKAELQAHMVLRRGQEWSKRQQVKKLYEEEFLEDDESEFDCKNNIDDDSNRGDDENDNSDYNNVSEDSENSDEDDEEENSIDLSKTFKKHSHKRNPFLDEEAEVSDDETQDNNGDEDEDDDDDDGLIPPYQKMADERDETNSVYDEESSTLLSRSPAFCLTALEGKDLQRSISFEESPVKQIVFTPLKSTKTSVPGMCKLIDSPLQTQGQQDLMGLCSGQFQSQPIRCSLLEANDERHFNSQDFSLTWPEESQQEEDSQKSATPTTQTSIHTSEWKNSILTKLISDDENSQDLKAIKKRRRKLSFSDDEDETAEENKDRDSDCDAEVEIESEEPSKSSEEHNESDSEFGDNQSEDNNREVDYDSEENEARFDGGKFLDVEAELSESEWDSADEDESNLDDMEKEEADKENIDEEAVKEELEKIHMKRMLVEDKKEVRLLQEMLLEDGDLHSDEGGRKRIFRWSNNDLGEEGPNKLDGESDEDKDVEEEDELAWRRFRHEREMYLREHKKKFELLEAEEDEEEDSQIIKLGRAALRKMNNYNNPPKSTLSTHKSPGAKCSLFQAHSRGSFLARGREVLTRLAHITTVSETNNAQLLQPKHSRNFVFSTISPQKKSDPKPPSSKAEVTKRKFEAEPVFLPTAKRPCLPKIIKPTNGRKSLLEQLAKCES